MIEIIPAILPKSFAELEDSVASARKLVPMVQIDICDGVFVPSRTWPYQVHGKADTDFEDILAEEKGLPFWQDIEFEIDLMVAHPDIAVPEWVSAGASRLIVHVESITDASFFDEYSSVVSFGVAINLDTSIETLEPFIDKVEAIQVMGIRRIGFQGENFDERAVARVAQLRKLYPNHIIGVDGGVSLETARALIHAGATRFVVGSALWGDGNLRENLAEFQKLKE